MPKNKVVPIEIFNPALALNQLTIFNFPFKLLLSDLDPSTQGACDPWNPFEDAILHLHNAWGSPASWPVEDLAWIGLLLL